MWKKIWNIENGSLERKKANYDEHQNVGIRKPSGESCATRNLIEKWRKVLTCMWTQLCFTVRVCMPYVAILTNIIFCVWIRCHK